GLPRLLRHRRRGDGRRRPPGGSPRSHRPRLDGRRSVARVPGRQGPSRRRRPGAPPMTAMTAGAERRRLPLVAAHWKMKLPRGEAVAYCRTLRRGLAWPQVKVILFPSFPLLPAVAAELADTEVTVGGQDLHPDERGAHTGDASAAQLVDAGCLWALCGHSERRRDHGESDELVARKAAAAARHGLLPLVCVGETREERMAERTFEVLARQLRAATGGRSDRLALAYEPVWAIGTGETATAE